MFEQYIASKNFFFVTNLLYESSKFLRLNWVIQQLALLCFRQFYLLISNFEDSFRIWKIIDSGLNINWSSILENSI